MGCTSDLPSVWVDSYKFKDAELQYYSYLAKAGTNSNETRDSLTCQVQKVRQQLHDQMKLVAKDTPSGIKVLSEQSFNAAIDKIHQSISAIEARLSKLELSASAQPSSQKSPQKPQVKAPTPAKKSESKDDDDDDVDLFGSDSEGEDEAAAKIREERLAAYAAKKEKKPTLIAKSNIIFDVKPWDDETDMKKLEAIVRSVEHDGLLWGAAKQVPLAYGIHKLQISSVIEDDKVSVDWLQETIEEKGSEFVQSVDIAAFNKV